VSYTAAQILAQQTAVQNDMDDVTTWTEVVQTDIAGGSDPTADNAKLQQAQNQLATDQALLAQMTNTAATGSAAASTAGFSSGTWLLIIAGVFLLMRK
jgi:hypothetical protein